MKKVLLATAAVAAVPCGAIAQSNVTVYGRLDVSAEYLKLDSTPTRASRSLKVLTSDASNLGFRGSEDLGSGLRAYFKLEHGISLDTGTQSSAAAFWNREAYVGLGDATFGSVQLGSQWAPGQLQSVKVDPFQRFGAAGQYTLMQGVRGYTLRYDNVVQYVSPTWAGVNARLYAAAGEGAATGKAYAANIDFQQGPIFFGAFFEQTRATAASVGLTGDPVISKTLSAAATYDFKVVKLHAQVLTNRIDRLGHVNAYLAGLTLPLGSGELKASYTSRHAANADASLVGLGYVYFLSKRTHLYTTVARLNNSGTAAFRMGPALTEQAALVPPAPGAGQDSKGAQVGIRHFF